MTETARRGPRGFTLAEILVTTVVIALGCLAALWLQSAALRGDAQAWHTTAASFLAESELERLRALSLPEVLREAGTPKVQTLNRLGELQADGPYTRSVRFFPRSPGSLSCQVEIETSWRDQGGRHSLILNAALTDFSF